METLLDRIKAENRRILNECGIHTTITFTPPSGEAVEVEGFYVDVSLDISPESGLPIKGRKFALTCHLSDFGATNPADTAGDWKASFINNMGDTITGYVKDVLPDRTLGMVTMTLDKLKEST